VNVLSTKYLSNILIVEVMCEGYIDKVLAKILITEVICKDNINEVLSKI
jgi:hypothetical protein